jgi:hypothetical protein
MTGAEANRSKPKQAHFCFALSSLLAQPKQPKQLPIGRGDIASPLARAAVRSAPADRGSAALRLRYAAPAATHRHV